MSRLKLHPKSPRFVADAAPRGAGLGRVELVVFLTIAFAVALSCNNYTPVTVTPPGKGTLPAPTKILVKVGNGVVELAWVFESDTTQVKEYRIYRRAQNDTSLRRIATVQVRRYRDDRLTNGQLLQYQIAAVNKSNVEGDRSATVTAMSAIYSIQLNGGAPFTNRLSVPITIVAPSNTALMKFAEDATFAGAEWELFATSRVWTLSLGDGLKKVFAKFRNTDDQETITPVNAEIMLDTFTNIKSIEENSQGKPLKVNESLRIRLVAGEKQGTAFADIVDAVNSASGQERNIRLYDDGTNGDTVANDGIYERDYTVRPGLEVVNAYVYGRFTDAAGNVASTATAPGRVTIQSPPTPVVLQEPTTIAGSSTSLSLRWTPNTDNDFASYQIRRSPDPVVSLASILVKEFNVPTITSHVDVGLDPGTKYFYRVYVFDAAGNNTGSNTVQQSTPINEAPKPVVLSQPAEEVAALTLGWSSSKDNDFANYRLYRSTTSPIDTTAAPTVVINNAATTTYRDTNVVPNVVYYYRILVFDQFGLSAGSNQVQGRPK